MFGHSKKDPDRYIIRASRKAYLVYYFMAIIIAFAIIYIQVNGILIDQNIVIASIVFIFLIIKSIEVHRFTHHYELTPHMLIKSEGIFIQRIKKMNYGSMSQIHLNRTLFHKIIGIGTIEIAQFSETLRTEIKNINKPEKVLQDLAKMVRKGHD